MSTSEASAQAVSAVAVEIDDVSLWVELSDGRTISAPLAWYPRLVSATKKERGEWRFIGDGRGIHWPRLDEDISVDNLLAGHPSAESEQSFQNWLAQRNASRTGGRGRQ
jgi:hypothetical protein